MDLKLADNIRTFRKERKLTQEQFAEIFDITPGAVYKWEAGLSVPELNLIVQMADFFDTSVDVLLGYQMKDNNIDAITTRLFELYQARNPDVLGEAEKALKKYPNSFAIVSTAAMIYRLCGTEKKNHEYLRRSIALSGQSLLLVSQNTDERKGELSIYGEMASAYVALGEYDKGIELLKKHNVMGMYSLDIGNGLLKSGNVKDAKVFLSESLLQIYSQTVTTVFGMATALCSEKKYSEARELVQFCLDMLKSVRKSDTTDIFDKIAAEIMVIRAYTFFKEGNLAEAKEAASEVLTKSRSFDAAPDYSVDSLKFVTFPDGAITIDSLGDTAEAGIKNVLSFFKDDDMNAFWKEISENE